MKFIPLTQGYFAKVDDSDFEKFGKFKWQIGKSNRNKLYARRTIQINHNKKTIRLHREIMNAPNELDVDHKDGDSLNCQRNNLRCCSHQQNTCNRQGPNKNSKSGVRGVFWRPDMKKWRVQIIYKGKKINLGYFDNIESAKNVREMSQVKYYGEFGR